MGGPKDAAKAEVGTANQSASTLSGRANSSWGSAFPELNAEATKPTGYTDKQMAGINTASQQGTGGATAGIVGQGTLMAGRTRNPGSTSASLAEAARTGGRTMSQNALNIKEADANLAHEKQQNALGELGKLYSGNVTGMSDMVKNANDATGNWIKAKQQAQDAITSDISTGMKLGTMGMTGAGMPGFSTSASV